VPRVLLTGATGVVGGGLLRRLVAGGDDVLALARSRAAGEALARAGATPVEGDVRDEDAMARAMAGCARVFHVAGINSHCPADPAAMVDVNVRGARVVVRAAARAGVRRLVYTSSSATIGEAPGVVADEDTPHRGWFLTLYERTKLDGELAMFEEAAAAGIEAVAVNPSSVQGPGRSGGTGAMLMALLNGRLPAFIDTHVSLVDIDDCATGHVLAAERGVDGRRYLLSGATMTSREMLELVWAIAGTRDRVPIVPRGAARALAGAVERGFRLAGRTPPICDGRVRTILHGHRYDGSRATRELGLVYTPVDETLRRTARWAVEEGLIRRPLPGLAR
jgi:dihydroflavonol-4-reductase